MNVLVTGGGGFLGSHLVEQLLARGDTVRALGRGRYPLLDQWGAETRRVDLRDRESVIAACAGIDIVFHAAGIAGIWGPWREFFGINVEGTRNILAGCQRHRVMRLVYTSSPSVTFDGSDQCGVDEKIPYPRKWLCHYAQTKAIAEQEVLAANGRAGLATCAMRPHLIWGPRDTQLVPRLIARAQSGQLRQVGNGMNLVDTVYVENAAAAHLAASERLSVDSPVAGKAYFLSQGEPVNCWQWIDRILCLANIPVEFRPGSKRALSFGVAWRAGAILEAAYRVLGKTSEPRMTRFLAAQLACSHWYDISAARRDFGYVPAISTDEGLRRMSADLDRLVNG